MALVITKTTPILRAPSQTGIFVQWTFSSAPPADVLHFTLERSGSSEGPFELVVENTDSYKFFDSARGSPAPALAEESLCCAEVETADTRENLNFLSLSRSVYYRVTAHFANGDSETAVRNIIANIRQRKLQLLRRKMQRDFSVALKFSGIDLAVLKRRHWGIRCRDCFDLLTKKVTKSKCNTCYGTGFEGGYFNPVRVPGRMGVSNVQTQITEKDKVDINKTRLTLLVVPEIEVDDIIVDVQNNKRYIVQTRHATEMQTLAVHQQLTVSELAKDSVEYRIPVNNDHIPVIY